MPAGQAQQFDFIGVRGVIGAYFQKLEQFDGRLWLDPLCNTFNSTQDTETYAGLGTSPQFREWIGKKHVKELSEFKLQITNKDWESTIRFKNKDMRRDKTGQIETKMGELAERTLSHDAKLISTLINNGAGTTYGSCYDGLSFWNTAHKAGAQVLNNSISVTIGSLPVSTHGSTTAPSVAEMALTIQQGISQIFGFVDDQGEPANEFANDFIIMAPVSLASIAEAACNSVFVEQGFSNPLLYQQNNTGVRINRRVIQNPRMTASASVAIFRADAQEKPFIIQLEKAPEMKVLAEGSDHEFWNNEHVFSVEKSGNVGYGRFDRACLVTMA